METALKIEDLGGYYVELPQGTYLIDGEQVYVTRKAFVKDLESVRRVIRNSVLAYYKDIEGNKLSVAEYTETEVRLRVKKVESDDVEDEVNHLRFTKVWSGIHEYIETISEPIKFPNVKSTVLDTGNKFIVSEFANGQNSDLLVYNRNEAWKSIVTEKMKELGMEFKPDLSYEQTKNLKVWSNSNHSGIKYVVAFGNYIFNDDFKDNLFVRGTLDTLLKRYEEDKKKIEGIIDLNYKVHFGLVDSGSFDFAALLKNINLIKANNKLCNYTKKAIDEYYFINRILNDMISQIELAQTKN